MYKISKRHLTLKEYILDLFSEKTLPYFLCFFAAVMMMVALIFSGSRGGMISIAISLTVFLGCALFLFRGLFRKFHALILLIALVFGFFWISKSDVGFVSKRFGALKNHFQARQNMWLDSLSMASDFQYFGIGLGTYAYLLPRYQHLFVPAVYADHRNYVDHAHNEYVEVLCETGLFGFFILLTGTGMTLLRALKRSLNPLRLGILTSLLSIIIHNFIDFNLRIPANALMYFLLFALLQIKLDQNRGSQ
jgi:O-antigen ligase